MKSGRIALAVGMMVGTLVVGPWGGAAPASAADIASVDCTPVQATGESSEPVLDAFDAMTPKRVVDTRKGTGGVDEALGAGCTLRIDTTSIAPAGAVGAALSVTVVATDPGFFTAFPCADGLPGTSSVNARPGLATANLVVVAPDSAGAICLYSQAGGHVIIDLSGWWSPGVDRFAPIDPVRAYDTRELATPTKLPATAIQAVEIGGRFVPGNAAAVAINVAAINPTTNGFLTVYPCGVAPPVASNLNFDAREVRAVSAIVELPGALPDPNAAGKICVTGSTDMHFIVDVTGYYAPTASAGPRVVLDPLSDVRVIDTREPGVPGVRFTSESTQRFDLSSAVDRSDETVAAVLNVVAVRAERAGFVTVYPCQATRPTTSSLNYTTGQTANLVVTPLSATGEICIFTSTPVDLVVDLVGAFAGPADSLLNQISMFDTDGEVVDLDQTFDRAGADYTVHCDGPLQAKVRVGLAPRASATVGSVPVPVGDPVDPDVAVTIPAEGLVTIAAKRGTDRATYRFRCVPADFPRLDIVRSGPVAPGWYVTGLGWNNPANGTFLAVMNERGVPIWFKRTETPLIDLRRLSNGNLVASPVTGTGFGIDPTAGHRVMGIDGSLLAVHGTDDPLFPVDHHDYVEVPGGGRAFLSYPLVAGVDLSGLPDAAAPTDPRCSYDDVPGADDVLLDGVIREVDSAGNLVFAFATSDHFGLDEVTYAQCFPNNYGLDEVDVFHLNSMQRVSDGSGDYVVAARHLDAVFRVDRSTNDVDWILGSLPTSAPNLSNAPRLTVVGDPLGGPRRMHDANLNGTRLTVHDNRTATGQPSRVVVYEIDAAAKTATLVRQINQPAGLTSTQLGSARVAADGSVLVNWGNLQPVFVEYDAQGTELQRMTMRAPDGVYRIIKYPVGAFDAATLRANAGGSVEAPV